MYFSNDKNWAALKAELDSWIGTPYRHFAKVKGRGADCILFIAEAFAEIGVMYQFTCDYYSRDWWVHTRSDLIRDMFVDHFNDHVAEGLRIDDVTKDRPKRGDIITFAYPRTGVTSHGSVYIGNGEIIQAHFHHGVSIQALDQVEAYPVSGIYRIMEGTI